MRNHRDGPGKRSAQRTAAQWAHRQVDVDRQFPDNIRAWPEEAIVGMLQTFARWSVQKHIEVTHLYTMCIPHPQAVALRTGYTHALYVSTRWFMAHGRMAHCQPLNELGRLH